MERHTEACCGPRSAPSLSRAWNRCRKGMAGRIRLQMGALCPMRMESMGAWAGRAAAVRHSPSRRWNRQGISRAKAGLLTIHSMTRAMEMGTMQAKRGIVVQHPPTSRGRRPSIPSSLSAACRESGGISDQVSRRTGARCHPSSQLTRTLCHRAQGKESTT